MLDIEQLWLTTYYWSLLPVGGVWMTSIAASKQLQNVHTNVVLSIAIQQLLTYCPIGCLVWDNVPWNIAGNLNVDTTWTKIKNC